MAGININTGGGGLALGAGSTATGATVVVSASGDLKAFDGTTLVSLLEKLASLKASLMAGGGGSGLTELMQLEQSIVENNGRVDQEAARRVLGRIRFAGANAAPVLDAVAAVSDHVRKRREPHEVFVSYKREQHDLVEVIVSALRGLSIDVWYDAQLQPGRSFTQEICEEIDHCQAQIVCWSQAATASPWVMGEAEIGRQRRVLIPVLLEECRLPPPFNMLHAESLVNWAGDGGDARWRNVLKRLGTLLNRPELDEMG